MTVFELYHTQIKSMPVRDRIKLASLILEGIPEAAVVDESDEWSDQDLSDLAWASWHKGSSGEGEDAGSR